ncbi:MAG: phosphoribosylamine--glycine ligase [Polyangiales bacterium]|nr:phosphoribosylamine--glycine ligase [Myxococcales bacterium]
MRILVVGSGAREHALAWRLSEEDEVQEVLTMPGNGGTARCSRNVKVDRVDEKSIVRVAKNEHVDFVVVGPEDPLVAGVVDALGAVGIPAFGPSKAAAQLEGSKAFSKEFMAKRGIPTADFRVFDDADKADAFIRDANRPLVVKADGLAAGKGVVVAKDAAEAMRAVDQIMRKRAFKEAGARVVVEECLVGEEVSFHVLSDGENFIPLAPAQDHKRAFNGDEGPNTGGMGAYSPPPVVDSALEGKILKRVIEPSIQGMAEDGMPFRGVLFVGLMIVRGEPQVLEYNVRFGDPECECLLPRWDGDLLPFLHGAATGSLGKKRPLLRAPASMGVVLASGGYPGKYETGKVITGVDAAEELDGVVVYHAGTRWNDGQLETAGGRVLTVSAIGGSVEEAAERAYRATDLIHFEGKQFRTDIGHRARARM